MKFQNRRDAGRVLARTIANLHDHEDAIVFGLPRGGVPVAYEVACELNLPLDIVVVRKLGVPGQEELAMGAIASGGTVAINASVVRKFGIPPEVIEAVAKREELEIKRREHAYRDDDSPMPVEGRTAILVDDGLATGASMLAAARALRPLAKQVIVAVPVAAESTCNEIHGEVDRIICVTTPRSFRAVGMYYRDFAQTTDEEIRALLSLARNRKSSQVA